MFCRDSELVEFARKHGLTTILCVGNGISMEPLALSRAGFSVTAMDISGFAVWICNHIADKNLDDSHFAGRFLEESQIRPGGSVEFVVGDLFDRSVCPGPYDIIIERRTIQDYPENERKPAIESVLVRLANPGLFFSHCHDNRFNPRKNPGSKPLHAVKPVVLDMGLPEVDYDSAGILDGQWVKFFTSTG